jgi:hypothetical protein
MYHQWIIVSVEKYGQPLLIFLLQLEHLTHWRKEQCIGESFILRKQISMELN